VAVYTQLGTGPSVTLTVPASGNVLVLLTAEITGSTGNAAGYMSVMIDGNQATALDINSLRVAGNNAVRATATALLTNLSPGSHTFTAVCKLVGSGTATFAARTITVIPG
jgi:hypothetical protein